MEDTWGRAPAQVHGMGVDNLAPRALIMSARMQGCLQEQEGGAGTRVPQHEVREVPGVRHEQGLQRRPPG